MEDQRNNLLSENQRISFDGQYWIFNNLATGQKIRYTVPDRIPVDTEWKIIGNLELDGWNLIGDPFFNVIAHKIGKNGHQQYAIGWEHPDPEKRAECPGYGFEDGFYFQSAEYIPISYVMGPLVGLQELKSVEHKRYVIDRQAFENKPLWRFRGMKTWLPMEPWEEVERVQRDLARKYPWGRGIFEFLRDGNVGKL